MRRLIRALPDSLVRTFARRYVAGDSLETAVNVAAALYADRGILATLDLLAEDIATTEDAARNVEIYEELIAALAKEPRLVQAEPRPTVSVKLSAYTTDPPARGGDGPGCRESLFRIATLAQGHRIPLTIDMEDSSWTDLTLDLFCELWSRGHHDAGIVLQSRLHRTESDLDQLPLGCRVRLVIGIYAESPTIALTKKPEMKERLLALGATLLQRGHYVELATHDEAFVRRFVNEVVPASGVKTDGFEIQMLYGVPRVALQKELQDQGIRIRLYIPFAIGWPMAMAYLRRRLDEAPGMMFAVARNLFGP